MLKLGWYKYRGRDEDILVPSLSWFFLNQYLSHTASPHTGHEKHNEALRHYIMNASVTVPGLTDQLWPHPPNITRTHTYTVYSCTQLWWKEVISVLQEVWEQDIFHWEGCQVFPLYTSLTLLFSPLYIVSVLRRSTPAYTSLYFHSLPLCFTVSLSLFLSVGRIRGRMGYSKSSLLTAGCKDSSVNQSQRCGDTESRWGQRLGSRSVSRHYQPCTRSPIRINTVTAYRSAGLCHTCSVMS